MQVVRKALVVGINDYPGAELEGCVNDANRIATVLERDGDGTPNFDVRLLTAPSFPLTKVLLKEAIDELFNGPSNVALLYFSGHGTITASGGYIVTPDYERYDEGISMDEILGYANRSNARDKIVILDCCHSGVFGTPNLSGRNIAELSEGLTVLTACRSSESAIEIGGGGVFTSLLLDALQGGASDLRGYITPGSLYSYVDEALGAWEQRPIFKTNISKFTSLRKVLPPIQPEVLRKICEYFHQPESEYNLNPTYEFTSDNAIEENVNVFKDLQKYVSVGLVKPVDEEHMFFAAMKSKSCKLTALGYQYWRLVKERKV